MQVTRGMVFIILVSLASSLVRVPFHLFRILCVDTHFEMRSVAASCACACVGGRSHAGLLNGLSCRSAASILDLWFWEQMKMFVLSLLFGIPLLSAYLVLLSWDLPYYWLCTIPLTHVNRTRTHDTRRTRHA